MIRTIIAGFVAAISFAVLYRVPRGHLLSVGLIGALGWGVNVYISQSLNDVVAILCGASIVAFTSELWARRRYQPVTLFLIPGIIPLVPGGQAYVTMLRFLQGNYLAGLEQLVSTLFLSGGIAGGILIVSSFFRFYFYR